MFDPKGWMESAVQMGITLFLVSWLLHMAALLILAAWKVIVVTLLVVIALYLMAVMAWRWWRDGRW